MPLLSEHVCGRNRRAKVLYDQDRLEGVTGVWLPEA
jgi:hypothetical protein